MYKLINSSITWLASGLFLGLGMALYGLLNTGGGKLPEETVARVNDRFISQADYARALAAVVTDSDQPLDKAQRRHILNRLIDEELLIQYGIDQGLVRSDRRVRANLVSAVLAAKSAAAETALIDDDRARAFYDEHRDYFSRPQQLRVTLLKLNHPDQAQAVREAWQAGAPVAGLQVNYAVQPAVHVPDALLPLGKLRQLIGASLADAATGLRTDEVSKPLQAGGDTWLLRVNQRLVTSPPFEQVVEQVKAEIRRRDAEAAVRTSLQRLREKHQVRIAEDRL